jgi:hypothetical protein
LKAIFVVGSPGRRLKNLESFGNLRNPVPAMVGRRTAISVVFGGRSLP